MKMTGTAGKQLLLSKDMNKCLLASNSIKEGEEKKSNYEKHVTIYPAMLLIAIIYLFIVSPLYRTLTPQTLCNNLTFSQISKMISQISERF